MKITLAENIRAFRKERSLTQEQLAEALGVTAGAVYKWEAKLSIPELELIVEMADFFDTSVDTLLGYEMKDNRLDATVKRLREYHRQKTREGLAEAEKALKKYHYSFRIVYQCALLYSGFGFESGDRALLRRALELFERSRMLLGQNGDPEIGDQTICGKIARVYLALDETEKGVELLKKTNAGGIFDHDIGHVLAVCERTEEAAPYLSKAFTSIFTQFCDTVIGYMNVFTQRGDYASAEAILSWAVGVFSGLRKGSKPNYLDKICSILLTARAGAQLLAGKDEDARASLLSAKALAAFFDANPSYEPTDIRFIDRVGDVSAYDDVGATAAQAVENVAKGSGIDALSALWESVSAEENSDDTK